MPESKKRKTATPRRTESAAAPTVKKRGPSPVWLAPLMLALFTIGLLWLVVFYLSGGELPIEGITNWNLVVGFGFIVLGFVLATQWR